MSIIIVDNGSKHTTSLLKALRHEKLQVINYQQLNYRNLSKGDVVILTGGHSEPILWHKKLYARETELIKHHKGPIIGICLGFELIAHVYRSHLHFLNKRRAGEIALTANGSSTLQIPKSVRVYEAHNWSVPKVKRPLKSLAYSRDGVEIFKHARKPIYGLQFHPEESSSDGLGVLSSILDKVST